MKIIFNDKPAEVSWTDGDGVTLLDRDGLKLRMVRKL